MMLHRLKTISITKIYQQLNQMLESLNLFRETRLLRFDGKGWVNSQCGGVASLLVFIAFLTILSLKLVEVFKLNTTFSTTETRVDFNPPMTNISTFQHQIDQKMPYMLAFQMRDRGCGNYTYEIRGEYRTQFRDDFGNSTIIKQPIVMEQCTADHFAIVPYLKNNIQKLEVNEWWCLPINKTYEVGGSLELSEIYKYIKITVACFNPCETDHCGSVKVHQLNSIINPDSAEPFEYQLKSDNMILNYYSQNWFQLNLDRNVLNTDQGIWPFENKTTTRISFMDQDFKNLISIKHNDHQNTSLFVTRSSITKTVNRKYLKLIDAASYVGGIFPVLLASMFFMNYFGLYFWEMSFAHRHFRSRQTKIFNFGRYIKNCTFYLLTKTGCKFKGWKDTRRHLRIGDSVKKMLDVNYLLKRIEFLQRAVSIVLEPHQIKGIYLSQITLDQGDKALKMNRLRDRFITFLTQKKIRERQKWKEAEYQSLIRPQSKSEVQRPILDKDYIDMAQHHIVFSDLNRYSFAHSKKEKERYLDKLSQQAEAIEKISRQQYDEDGLMVDLEMDIKKLFKEAESRQGDPKSKSIVNGIDRWLKRELDIAIQWTQMERGRSGYLVNEYT